MQSKLIGVVLTPDQQLSICEGLAQIYGLICGVGLPDNIRRYHLTLIEQTRKIILGLEKKEEEDAEKN